MLELACFYEKVFFNNFIYKDLLSNQTFQIFQNNCPLFLNYAVPSQDVLIQIILKFIPYSK